MWYCNNTTEIKPIGLKQPNNWGLHDMLGNIWEWTDYVYKGLSLEETVGQQAPLTDPVGDGAGNRRDLRGGSFRREACHSRSADQFGTSPENRFMDTGFRPVRTLNPPPQPDAGVDAGK
jgi:formylglycine-generating enzyme required for sulfatase activity